MMGFIFFSQSPRYIGDIADPSVISSIPSPILKTGVFVNEKENTIIRTADKFHLDIVQLHGEETPEFCKRIRDSGLKVTKAFRINKKEHLKVCSAFTECSDLFLFDTHTDIYGGSGQKFDWTILDHYHIDHPFLISGGIATDDAEKIQAINNPYLCGVDLNSRFEVSPGIKDINELKKFISKIRQF